MVARAATVVLAVVSIVLGIAFKGQNVAYMVGLAFAIAASANFPALVLSIFWKRLTTAGAQASMIVGTVSTLALIYLSPTIQIDILKRGVGLVPAAQSRHRDDSAVVRRGDRGVAAAARCRPRSAVRRARAAAAPRCRVEGPAGSASIVPGARHLGASLAALGWSPSRSVAYFTLRSQPARARAPSTYEQITRAFYRGLAALEVGLLDDARAAVHARRRARARGAGGVGQPRPGAAAARRARGAAAGRSSARCSWRRITATSCCWPARMEIGARPAGRRAWRSAPRGGARPASICGRGSRWPRNWSAPARPTQADEVAQALLDELVDACAANLAVSSSARASRRKLRGRARCASQCDAARARSAGVARHRARAAGRRCARPRPRQFDRCRPRRRRSCATCWPASRPSRRACRRCGRRPSS